MFEGKEIIEDPDGYFWQYYTGEYYNCSYYFNHVIIERYTHEDN